ncbi:MAG: DUF5659 domain-containing protein [Clostridium sp.]|uniref:DUF5659 domain-containing protein n=1 Tax=Clostridium sp. TaxID=1506 RepID=UPI00290DF9DB|nr:DUF5659 domain-containing protein [Clostridium sp.]MDU7337933.1 DUF5659 domain-containing protein [Clostridium sp.]
MDKVKTRAVKNRNVAVKLVNAGFELLNITKSYDDGKPCFIFEDTKEFAKKFDELLGNVEKSKKNDSDSDCSLTWIERQYLIKFLQNRKQEYQSMGVNVDTIDTIICKLKKKNQAEDEKNKSTDSALRISSELAEKIKKIDTQKLLGYVNKTDVAQRIAIENMSKLSHPALGMNYPWMNK